MKPKDKQQNLEDDHMCFACGKNNHLGLRLEFSLQKDNTLIAEFTPRKEHQGFKGLLHGGIIAAILDEAMANLNWKLGKATLTAELEVRFKSPAKIGQKLLCKGSIVKEDTRLVYNEAILTKADSKIVASAKAKCFKILGKT